MMSLMKTASCVALAVGTVFTVACGPADAGAGANQEALRTQKFAYTSLNACEADNQTPRAHTAIYCCSFDGGVNYHSSYAEVCDDGYGPTTAQCESGGFYYCAGGSPNICTYPGYLDSCTLVVYSP